MPGLKDILSFIANAMAEGLHDVSVEGRLYPVGETSIKGLPICTFVVDGKVYKAIAQNPEKLSHWGKLAREGHKVMQVLNNRGQYIAAVVDGKVMFYSRTPLPINYKAGMT